MAAVKKEEAQSEAGSAKIRCGSTTRSQGRSSEVEVMTAPYGPVPAGSVAPAGRTGAVSPHSHLAASCSWRRIVPRRANQVIAKPSTS